MTITPDSPNNTPATVLVLGANGRLGAAAVQAFARAGWQVVAQARQPAREPLPAGVQWLQADVLDHAAIVRAVPRAALIVHAVNPHYARWATLLPPITDSVIAIARATGATVMLPGNVYNFGRALPPVLTESTPFVANTEKAAQRIALEEALAGSGVRSIVIRAGDFLGERGTWMDLAIARSVPRGRVSYPGPVDLPHAWAWLPDLAEVFVRVAAQRAQLPPHASLHYAGLTLTGTELMDAIDAAVGRRLQRRPFAWWQWQLVAPVMPIVRAVLGMRYLWQRPHRLDDSRLRALIGPPPQTPLAEVVAGSLAAAGVQNLSSQRRLATV
ncbi:NAD(P)H-binding protein [Aquabacterium sp.]|uniref:NmrA family NAD(P)-binding protein n=1 Tax=Aquabacterium sp. TaxID=1872578 RepID=UPI003784C04D